MPYISCLWTNLVYSKRINLASDHIESNHWVTSPKVFLLTGKPYTGNNVEYKLISVPLMVILLAVYTCYVQITPRLHTENNNKTEHA